jgi:molybdopterin-biosynthesis enzyme MoeA-like protein
LRTGCKRLRGGKVVVVNGGLIKRDVTAEATAAGCEVTMVFPEEVIMSRPFTEEIGVQYEAAFEDSRTGACV